MDNERRTFLRRSLAVLGSIGAGGIAVRALTRETKASAAAEAPAPATRACCIGAGNPGAVTPSLTPDHQIVHYQGGKRVSLPVVESSPRVGIPGRRFVMVFDLSKCDGCGKCTEACSKMHFVPPGRQWIKVLRMQDAENTAPYFFPQPCFHCDNPPCTKVCPVDATFKRQDGIVLIDNERCIGCRFCMAACPYGARSFNWGRPNDPPEALAEGYSPEHGFPRRIGTVEKCDFCPDMAERGELPGCVSGCPMGAIYYGDENEDAVTNSQGDTQRFSKMLVDRSGYRHLEELGTKPRVYYLPPTNREFPIPRTTRKTGEQHE